MTGRAGESSAIKAVVQRRYGSVEDLSLETIPMPVPGRGEVLVGVRAAAIDAGTVHLMAGVPYVVRLGVGISKPRQPVPGRDLAGVVTAIGLGVDQFAVGDRVAGIGAGTLAEYSVASVKGLVRLPDGVDFAAAATVPISGITALQALRRHGRIDRGDRVLVLGASGGVGSFAVQLAAEHGARITAVCSAAKAAAVRAWGAGEVIGYDQSAGHPPEGPFDLIIDIAGDRRLAQLRSLLTPAGTLVIVGGDTGRWLGLGRQFRAMLTSPFTTQNLSFLISGENSADIETMITKVDRGAIRAPIDRIFDLDDAPAALQYLMDGKATGKIAVRI